VTLLNRYILAQFMRHLITIMLSLIAIYLLIDFFEKIDNFQAKGKPMSMVFKFFALNIPFILDQMSPVCILLAGVVTLGILNSSNELIALKASGIPLQKIIFPIIAAGIGVTLTFLAMSQFVLPTTSSGKNRIWNEELLDRVSLGIYRNGRFYYRGSEGVYSFAKPSMDKNEFSDFSYAVRNPDLTDTLITAALALYSKEGWTLLDGQVQQGDPNGDYATTIFSQREFSFPEVPSNFFIAEYRSQELSLTGLFWDAWKQKNKEEAMEAWANFYGRLSYTMLGLPLLLLGLPLLLLVYRRWGRDLSLAIPVACGMAFVSWGGWSILQSMAKAGYIHPFFAAVLVHVIISWLGMHLLKREDL